MYMNPGDFSRAANFFGSLSDQETRSFAGFFRMAAEIPDHNFRELFGMSPKTAEPPAEPTVGELFPDADDEEAGEFEFPYAEDAYGECLDD